MWKVLCPQNDTEVNQKSLKKGKLDQRLNRMEKRITKAITGSIKKLIENGLQPFKEDVRKLFTSLEKQ